MNNAKKLLAAAVALAWTLPLAADNHEPAGNQKLAIHYVNVKMGHGMAFRAGMEAYSKCLAEGNYDDSYSVWRAVDGDRTGYHIVSSFGAWAELDENDEVSDACWEKEGMREGVFGHLSSWETHYAERMPDWSGSAEGFSVVKLHNFRVKDGEKFRSLVTEMTGYLKEAEYEHQGVWWDVESSGYWQPDYFVVEHYKNFADMDEDRKGVSGVLTDAVGEEKAKAFWDAFGEALADQKGYWTTTLARVASMGYSPDDD